MVHRHRWLNTWVVTPTNPAAASVGGIGTIIGSTPNAIAVGALQEQGINNTFIDWMLVGTALGLLLVFLFYKFLSSRLKVKESQLDLSQLPQSDAEVDPFKCKAVIVTLCIAVRLWITEPLHGIPLAATSAVSILLLTLTQVINSEQVISLPWDTLMLVAGGLAPGIAMPVIAAISCSCSLLLPVSTPPNANAYATGIIDQREFRRGGIFFIFAGPISAFAAVMAWVWLYV